MTKQVRYQIQFYGYWHVGSGLSAGAYADAVVLKDQDELPIIPGKTLKGLLRDAARTIQEFQPELISKEFMEYVFGEPGDINKQNQEEAPYKPSACYFSNATLSGKLREELLHPTFAEELRGVNLTNTLYEVLASTQIENGIAKDSTLRQLEVCVPLTLHAMIEGENSSDYAAELDLCFGWIKRMGLNRNRGLGKCRFTRITDKP